MSSLGPLDPLQHRDISIPASDGDQKSIEGMNLTASTIGQFAYDPITASGEAASISKMPEFLPKDDAPVSRTKGLIDKAKIKLQTNTADQPSWSKTDAKKQTHNIVGVLRGFYFSPGVFRTHAGQRLAFGEDGRAFVLNVRFGFWRVGLNESIKMGAVDATTEAVSGAAAEATGGGSITQSIANFFFNVLGFGLIKDFFKRTYADEATLYSLGSGDNRVKLTEKMKFEAQEDQTTSENKHSKFSIKKKWNDFKIGISKENLDLKIGYKPVDIFNGFNKVVNTPMSQNESKISEEQLEFATPEDFLKRDEESVLGQFSQMVTFGAWLMRDHAIRRAEKETGPYGAIFHMFRGWGAQHDDKYGAEKAKKSIEKDQETIKAYSNFMDNAADKLKVDPTSIGEIEDFEIKFGDLKLQERKYQQIKTQIGHSLNRAEYPDPDLIQELNNHAEYFADHQKKVSIAMLQIHLWMKKALQATAIEPDEIKKLEILQDQINRQLEAWATEDHPEAYWNVTARSLQNYSFNKNPDNNIALEEGVLSFLQNPHVKELRALLEMTEGAIAIAEAKNNPAHPLNESLNDPELSNELKLERVINFGQKVYSELNKHVQIWFFNKYFSPKLTLIEQFSEFVSIFGIYRFGPVQPDSFVLRRYPSLQVNVQKEALDPKALNKKVSAIDVREYVSDERQHKVDAVVSPSESTPISGYQGQYRFVACLENDKGHKSYILDPVKEDGSADLDPSRKGFFIGLGTQFEKEIYSYRDVATRSGIRTDLQTDIARSAANQKVEWNDGEKTAFEVIGEYFKGSPHKYACIGHSLGASTVEGVVTSEGFPVDKISFVGSFSSPGIRESDNLRFYESVTSSIFEKQLPLQIISNIMGEKDEVYSPEFEEWAIGILNHYFGVIYKDGLNIESFGSYQDNGELIGGEQIPFPYLHDDDAFITKLNAALRIPSKKEALLQVGKAMHAHHAIKRYNESISKIEGKGNKEKLKSLIEGRDKLKEIRGFQLNWLLNDKKSESIKGALGIKPVDFVPKVTSMSVQWDLIGHLGSAPYNLGLVDNAVQHSYYEGLLKFGTTVAVTHYVGKEGYYWQDRHNYMVFEDLFSEVRDTMTFQVVDSMSLLRRSIKMPTRALWKLIFPIRVFAKDAILALTERNKVIWGYGTDHTRYGSSRLRNRATIIKLKS